MILFYTIMLGCLYLIISTLVRDSRNNRCRVTRLIVMNQGLSYPDLGERE